MRVSVCGVFCVCSEGGDMMVVRMPHNGTVAPWFGLAWIPSSFLLDGPVDIVSLFLWRLQMRVYVCVCEFAFMLGHSMIRF